MPVTGCCRQTGILVEGHVGWPGRHSLIQFRPAARPGPFLQLLRGEGTFHRMAMNETPHVLIVDDNREIRETLSRYLERHAYRITTAEDATAARRLLKASAPDLLIVDIMMPGEDGLSFCRHVRETADLP